MKAERACGCCHTICHITDSFIDLTKLTAISFTLLRVLLKSYDIFARSLDRCKKKVERKQDSGLRHQDKGKINTERSGTSSKEQQHQQWSTTEISKMELGTRTRMCAKGGGGHCKEPPIHHHHHHTTPPGCFWQTLKNHFSMTPKRLFH